MQQQISQSSPMMGQESVQVNRQALARAHAKPAACCQNAQEELVEKTWKMLSGSAGFVEAARDQRVNLQILFSQIYRLAFSGYWPRCRRFHNLNQTTAKAKGQERHLDRAVQLR